MCSQEEDEDCSCVFNSIIKKNERSCFIHHCLHKVNMIFGKYKLTTTQMNSDNNMAIAYSGGQNSSTLLNLIIQVMITFDNNIDDVIFQYNNHDNGIKKRTRMMIPKVFHLIETNKWKSKLTSSSLSSQQRFNDYYRLNLLIHCARKLDCKYLVLGECGNRVSVKYLLEIIEGRGNHSSIQTSFLDDRYQDITIVRPLRDFLAKEIALYAHFMHLEFVTPNDPLTSIVLKNPNVNTLERLTQDFLATLQTGGFPSTTGTILRTSSKIVLENDSQITCSFCHVGCQYFSCYITNSYCSIRKVTEKCLNTSQLQRWIQWTDESEPMKQLVMIGKQRSVRLEARQFDRGFPLPNTDPSNDPDKLATESVIHSSSLSNPDSFNKKTVTGIIEDLCLSCSLMFKELSLCT
ncbi:unnamed protein product [Schistosoma margrebowiei]|uniref:Cytoplasmic tRNA 2-thiolation protein 2 n=1 Tax=Schistosoma margrebowiei TaxID=48269 RepID=A0A183MMS4_9TREM|nr:unnamed protein product [Schistosoma margrebowiei]